MTPITFISQMLATKSDGQIEEKKNIYLDFTQSMFRTANPLANRLRILLLLKTWKKHSRNLPSIESIKGNFHEGDVEETLYRRKQKFDSRSSSFKNFNNKDVNSSSEGFIEYKTKSIKLLSKNSNTQKKVTFLAPSKVSDNQDTDAVQDSKIITSDRLLTQDLLITKEADLEEYIRTLNICFIFTIFIFSKVTKRNGRSSPLLRCRP
jgi:hypothetical protein